MKSHRFPYSRPSIQFGFGLVELMVSILLSIFISFGLVVIYVGVKGTFKTQDDLSRLQDSQRLISAILANTIQSAGYFVNPVNDSIDSVFPVTTVPNRDGTTFSYLGQSVVGKTTNTPQGDSINIRYQTASGDGLMNCQGQTNQSGSSTVWINSFSVNASNQLECSVNGSTPVPLVDNVSSIKFLYSVDTDGDNSPDGYLDAASVASSGLWKKVYSAQFSITFVDTINSTPTNIVNLPTAWMQTVKLMSLI